MMASHETESLRSVNDAQGASQHKSYKSVLPATQNGDPLTVPRRRKYAKLKVKFEQAMRRSNALVKEELRIIDLAQRIKEQNEYVAE